MDLTRLENIVHHLNCRWKLQVLSYWTGTSPLFNPASMYEGYENVINTDVISSISEIPDKKRRICIKHGLIDHYLQRSLMPYEAEMRTWMAGAAAYVNGKKIYIREIIPYCQKSSTLKERRILQKEIAPLSRFLKPFILNYWELLLQILQKDLGYKNYLDYCMQKKEMDYPYFYIKIKELLSITDPIYYSLMNEWTKRRFGLPLYDLTRFDAINILSLGEFDPIFPEDGLERFFKFLRLWDINVKDLPGLYLDISPDKKKSAQAMSFIVQVPEEVYVVIRPVGGWIDLETLAHELGHGLSAVYTMPDLPIIDRDLSTSYILSESFAFLLQNISMSKPFLKKILGISEKDADRLYYHKVLKDLSVLRRYAAKFMVEYEMFLKGNISDGELYSEYMTKYTGFYYQPESHLFDLVPEFYSLDYVIAWIVEAIMEKYLKDRFGNEWMLKAETSRILKKWWAQGNKYNIFQFLEVNKIGQFTLEPLIERWERVFLWKR